MDPSIGHEFDSRYLIKAALGSGGMGRVYLAEDLKQGGEAAIKVLKAELGADAKMRRRFVKESQIFSYLKHPNIVKVLGFGQSQDRLYMVMEYLRSVSLREIMDLVLPFSFIVEVMEQLLAALTHAHFRGIIHRDIKPSNILLTLGEQGELVVKLVDFGVASLPSFAQQTQAYTQSVLGSPHYMAPEQSRGIHSQIGPGTDIYSVGIVLYELLSGKVPFVGESDVETILMHIDEALPALSLRDGVRAPAGVQALIMKATQKKTWERYVGAHELSNALQALSYDKEESQEAVMQAIRTRIRAKAALGHAARAHSELEDDTRRTEGSAFQEHAEESVAEKHVDLKETSTAFGLGLSVVPLIESKVEPIASDLRMQSGLGVQDRDPPSFHPLLDSGLQSAVSLRDSGSHLSASSSSLSMSSSSGFRDQEEVSFTEQEQIELARSLIGRGGELGVVHDVAELAMGGKGNVLVMEGDWGIGKSKIAVYALKHLIDGKHMQFGVSFFGANMQQAGLRNMFEGLLQCREIETPSLCEYLSFHYRKLKLNNAEDIAALLSFLRPDDPVAGQSPDPFMLVDILAAVSETLPVAILLEDIHEASEADLAFIECFAMQSALQRMRCLLIASVSPKEVFGGTRIEQCLRSLTRHEGGSVKTLRVNALPEAQMQEFFTKVFHFDRILSISLSRHSYGNPMLARELAKTQKNERLIVRGEDGVYSLRDGAVCKIDLPQFFKEAYLSYIDRLIQRLSAGIEKESLNAIILRLAILGEEFEDALLEQFFEKEGRQELCDALDVCLESLIKARLIFETSSRRSQNALRFESRIAVMAILSTHSLRSLRPLHRLAIEVKTQYYHNEDMLLYHELSEHYLAIGATQDAHKMLFKAFEKAVQANDQERIYYYGTQLYQVFTENFLRIRDYSKSMKMEDITQPIDWPFVVMELGKIWVVLGKHQEAEQFVDALIYCAQRYQAPILQARGQTLSAMFFLLKENYPEAIAQMDASDQLLVSLNDEGMELFANMITRLQIYAQHGMYKNLLEAVEFIEQTTKDKKLYPYISFFRAVCYTSNLLFEDVATCLHGVAQAFQIHKIRFFTINSEKMLDLSMLWRHQPSKQHDSAFLKGVNADATGLFELYLDCFRALFYISQDRLEDAAHINTRATDFFMRKKSSVGLSFCFYVDALLLYHQLHFQEAFSQLRASYKEALETTPWVLANVLLALSLHSLMLGDIERAKLYLRVAGAEFDKQSKGFILQEAVALLILCIENSSDPTIIDRLDQHFAKPNARNNYLFSLPVFAMYVSCVQNNESKLFQYYGELSRSHLSVFDKTISKAFDIGSISNIITYVEALKLNTIEYNSMRANLDKLQTQWDFVLEPTLEEAKVDFALFDADYLLKSNT